MWNKMCSSTRTIRRRVEFYFSPVPAHNLTGTFRDGHFFLISGIEQAESGIFERIWQGIGVLERNINWHEIKIMAPSGTFIHIRKRWSGDYTTQYF